MLLSEGVHAVRVTKVKGHASEEGVSEGKVKREDKDDNDTADVGASKGSSQAQELLANLAGLYGYRNEKYRCVVERIQNVIIKMKTS